MRERSTAFFVGKAKHRICAGLKLEHRAITMLVAYHESVSLPIKYLYFDIWTNAEACLKSGT